MTDDRVWRVFEFKTPESRDGAISEWLAGEEPEIGDELRDTLWYLVNRDEWRRPKFDAIDNGLFEIRCKSKPLKTQIRVYGIWGPTRRCFTMLVGATKKESHKPKGAKKTAKTRKRLVEGDWSLVEEFTDYP